MPTTEQEIESFARFAREHVSRQGQGCSMEELFDLWRLEHPPSMDATAIRASLRDMEGGEEGREFADFAEEFLKHGNSPRSP